MDSSDAIISLQHLSKQFDGTTVVEDFNLDVKAGEFITILGPSGCGKTTTLRMIAGFELPTQGKILLNGEDISYLPPYKRPVNTVFQHYALFSHLDVYDNVAFGLKMKRIPVEVKDRKGNVKIKMKRMSPKQIDAKVSKALEIVDLDEMEDRDVATLSGGQQQRVAIARAIVNEPKVLLLDEPLSALDHKMRKDMQLELKQMHKRLGITFFYVTHDQEEALTMSDRIVVMKDGVIQQVGTPEEIYEHPRTRFAAQFIGQNKRAPTDLYKKSVGVYYLFTADQFRNVVANQFVISPLILHALSEQFFAIILNYDLPVKFSSSSAIEVSNPLKLASLFEVQLDSSFSMEFLRTLLIFLTSSAQAKSYTRVSNIKSSISQEASSREAFPRSTSM